MLNLTWDDIGLRQDASGLYVSIRLRWHKKASVEEDSQVYCLVDEQSYPCLKVCTMFMEYQGMVRSIGINLSTRAFVFPSVSITEMGQPRINLEPLSHQKESSISAN